MPIYTVLVTVRVQAEHQQEADSLIRGMFDGSVRDDLEYVDSEVVETEDDEDEEPPAKLTRQERLQALADSGTDTLEEYRGER